MTADSRRSPARPARDSGGWRRHRLPAVRPAQHEDRLFADQVRPTRVDRGGEWPCISVQHDRALDADVEFTAESEEVGDRAQVDVRRGLARIYKQPGHRHAYAGEELQPETPVAGFWDL